MSDKKSKKEKTKAEKKGTKEKVSKKAKTKVEELESGETERKARGPQRYRKDHITILERLGSEIPKRPSFKVSDLASLFADGENITADRIARNSIRKPIACGLVERIGRGEVRLTTEGVSFVKRIDDYEVAPESTAEEKPKAVKKPKKDKTEKKGKKEKKSKKAKKAKKEKKAKEEPEAAVESKAEETSGYESAEEESSKDDESNVSESPEVSAD